MHAPALLLAAALFGIGAEVDSSSGADIGSLETALLALSSENASERSQGERWLGAHLEESDYPLLAEAALSGGRETQTRVVRALGADDRHLGLSLLLATDKSPALVALGEEAIRELAGRWHTGLGLPMALDDPNRPALRDALVRLREAWPAERYRLELDGSIEDVVGRFARLAELPVSLCVDPYAKQIPFAESAARRVLEGTWDELVLELAVEYSVNLAGALTTNDKGDVLPLFLCFRPRESGAGAPAVEVLTDWCRQSLEGGPGAERAARALAGSGWPAAVQWLDRRARQQDDPAAEAGLLLAASRGRVALSLHRPETVVRLLARADTTADRGEAERIMHALASMLPVALNGARLDELIAADLLSLDGRSLRLRLVVLEGMTSSSPLVRTALRALLARPHAELSPSLRLQALRAWSAVGDRRELELAGVGKLFAASEDRQSAEELVHLLSSAGVAPNKFWERPSNTSSHPLPARAAALEWNLTFGRTEAASNYLGALTLWKTGWPREPGTFRATAEVAEVLRRRVRAGDRARVGHWLEQVSSDAASADEPRPAARRALHRLVILCGAPSPEQMTRDLDCMSRALPDPKNQTEFSPGDELVLGVLASRPTAALSRPARNFLFQRLTQSLALSPDIPANLEMAEQSLAGIERCAVEMLARGEDSQVELMARDIRILARRHPAHPLSARMEASAWPPGPSSQAIELARLDREL